MSDSAKLDRAQIEHVATLAALSLTTEEMDRMTRELAAILAYVEDLSAVDTSQVEPTRHVQLEPSAFRRDEVRPGVSHDEALSQAPRKDHGGFAVPAFVE
jgi:aspartyl-tRNA(Asn)/glutamyl-tRNA(Gln) amidotransferase subunit C